MAYVSQHYVSRFYLVKFASKTVLWEFDKTTGASKASTAEECGCEDHYHAVEKPDGTVDTETIEKDMEARFERGMVGLYPLLRNRKPFTGEQWEAFHKFAASMFVRVPRFVGTIRDFLTGVLGRAYEVASQQPEFIEKCVNDGVPIEAIKSSSVTATRGYALTTSLEAVSTPLHAFSNMSWCFYEAPPKMFFVTGDNPVFYCVPNRTGLYPPALYDRDVEVTFPLSKSICAVGTWGDEFNCKGQYIPVKEEVVHEINRRTIRAARHFVYGPENTEKILAMMKPK